MPDNPKRSCQDSRDRFCEGVGTEEARRLRARRHREHSIWFGLGTFGMVGWSVVVPTLVGIGLGIWIDARWPGRFSWTLMLLIAGIALGCLNAWYWVAREREIIEREEETEENE